LVTKNQPAIGWPKIHYASLVLLAATYLGDRRVAN
jgi:hypothetical protein